MFRKTHALVLSLVMVLVTSCLLSVTTPEAPTIEPPTAEPPTIEPPTTQPPTEPPLVPAGTDIPAGKGTLTIVRTLTNILGQYTITAAIPLTFGIDESEPKSDALIFGTGVGTAALIGQAKGNGGAYAITAEWPVDYEVKGHLTPRPDVCKISLTVDEIMLLSQTVTGHADPLGDFQVTGGEDQFSYFPDLQFTEINVTVTRKDGTIESNFTIDDLCLPKWTGCTYDWPQCTEP